MCTVVEKDSVIERLRTELGKLHRSKRQLNEQKDLELGEKNVTIGSYLDKIVHLMKNSAHKEARVTEVEAELGRCPAACTRLEQEKEILERQNAWLNEELTAKIETSKKMNELSNLPLLSFSTEPYVLLNLFAVWRHLTILIFPSFSCVLLFSLK
ncbi:hypothetical protein MtrunA17_Chr2g0304771 [Medicago truncatula]|uniref:Nucleoprotein TPR/MPL1 domain-containing protein n=1 Tax=Medicago truncatula TaxID=3880 RepID=A0A396JC06_MEDTR|nr:hypothetical protein MtrunA17_Chr2g0304771 [Medicago truncatula]